MLTRHGKTHVEIDVDDLHHLIRCALFAAQDHVKTAEALAASLRAGNHHALFADGEDGARAADAMAENHRSTVERAEMLLDALDDGSMVYIYTE